MSRLTMTAGLAVILLVGTGCAPRAGTATNRPSFQTRPSSTAAVSILEPGPAAVVTGTILKVRLSLTGGRIIPETKTQLTPDEGHIHLLVDGKVVSMTYGVEQEVQVTKGTHLLQAEFVAADHFPFNPRVMAIVTFKVE